MPVYQKVDGVWKPAALVYVKINGVNTLVDDAYVKVAGTWRTSHHYDVTPPAPPEITAAIVDTNNAQYNGNYILLGVRQPGGANNPSIRRIRVLTTYQGAYPTSQYGATYTGSPADSYPGEPWSEWRYNGFGNHLDTSLVINKKWPRNAAPASQLVPGQKYHFTAWSEDFSGNWSAATSMLVTGPKKGVDSANVVHKRARFQALSSGYVTSNSFTAGTLYQSGSPYRYGIYFYGNQINEAIGQQGAPTVSNAQILVSRADDPGSASANVYVYWHEHLSAGDLVYPPLRHTVTKVGTIAKGESKWITLPETFHTAMENNTLRGFGFFNRDPIKASAFADDYSEFKSVTDNQRAGEVVIAWSEAL